MSYVAPLGLSCEFDGCAAVGGAVHRWRNRDLCAYHSPYDVVRCEECSAVTMGESLCGECATRAEIEAAHAVALVENRRLTIRQRRSPNLTMAGMLATRSGLRCNACFGYGNGLCADHVHLDWSVVSRLTEPQWGAELHGPWNPGVTVCPSVGNGCTHTSVVDDGAIVACAL